MYELKNFIIIFRVNKMAGMTSAASVSAGNKKRTW